MIRTERLDAVVALADRLRARRQAARSLTLTVAFADRSSISRSRTLPEAASHTEDFRVAAYRLFDGLALQRARVRGMALRADQLTAIEAASGGALCGRRVWRTEG